MLWGKIKSKNALIDNKRSDFSTHAMVCIVHCIRPFFRTERYNVVHINWRQQTANDIVNIGRNLLALRWWWCNTQFWTNCCFILCVCRNPTQFHSLIQSFQILEMVKDVRILSLTFFIHCYSASRCGELKNKS